MADRRRADGDGGLQSLLEALPDATLLVRKDGRIVMANKLAHRVFGYRSKQLVGVPVGALVPGRLRPRHAGLHAAYAAHPASRAMGASLELVARRRDGSEFPAEISLGPLESRGETVYIAAVRDLGDGERLRKTGRRSGGGSSSVSSRRRMTSAAALLASCTTRPDKR